MCGSAPAPFVCPCSKVFTADEVADTVAGILDKLNVKEACVVGHSYGEQQMDPVSFVVKGAMTGPGTFTVCLAVAEKQACVACHTPAMFHVAVLFRARHTRKHTHLRGVLSACAAGTFIAGMLARNHRKRVHTLCLIDPVCFGMFMPHLLYNFLYRVPVRKGWSITQ